MLCPMMIRTKEFGSFPAPATTPAPQTGAESAFLQRFMARVPADVASSFSPEQLAAVQRAFGMRYTVGHTLDVRRSVSLPWGRYYVVMMAGRDRASPHAARIASSLLAAIGAFGGAMLTAGAFMHAL